MDKLKDEYEKMKNQYNLDGDAEQKENKKKLDFLINKVLTLLQEAGKEEAEFQRLMKLPEFRQAMATGKKYDWPKDKLMRKALEMETELAGKGDMSDEDKASAAVEMVVAQIRADRLQGHVRGRAMKHIGNIMFGQADEARKVECFTNWSTRAQAEIEAEYQRLLRKFQQAMLCGRKYDWDRIKCIQVGLAIEAQFVAKGVPKKDQPKAATDAVVAKIKQEKSPKK